MKINLINKLTIFSLIFISNNLFSVEIKGESKDIVEAKPAHIIARENLFRAFNEIPDSEDFFKLPINEQARLMKNF